MTGQSICGEHFRLTDLQRHLLEQVRALGLQKFAPRAAQYDRDATFPFENYADLRDAGLLAVCVPVAYGGLGADYPTYMLLAAEMGRHCGATALTFNMHVCSTLWSGLLADDLDMTEAERAQHEANRRVHFGRIVGDGAIY